MCATPVRSPCRPCKTKRTESGRWAVGSEGGLDHMSSCIPARGVGGIHYDDKTGKSPMPIVRNDAIEETRRLGREKAQCLCEFKKKRRLVTNGMHNCIRGNNHKITHGRKSRRLLDDSRVPFGESRKVGVVGGDECLLRCAA
jgi:hypothetical protein